MSIYQYLCLYIFSFLFFSMIILYIENKNFNKQNILNYINTNIYDYKFRKDIIKLAKPRVGEIVKNISKPWYGMSGYVTRINNDNTCNIKITKSLNPNKNKVPKRVITKLEQEIKLY